MGDSSEEEAGQDEGDVKVQRVLGTGKMGTKALKRPDRSLAFFIMALQGHSVIIELRNTAFIKGTVYIADMYMKCDLAVRAMFPTPWHWAHPWTEGRVARSRSKLSWLRTSVYSVYLSNVTVTSEEGGNRQFEWMYVRVRATSVCCLCYHLRLLIIVADYHGRISFQQHFDTVTQPVCIKTLDHLLMHSINRSQLGFSI